MKNSKDLYGPRAAEGNRCRFELMTLKVDGFVTCSVMRAMHTTIEVGESYKHSKDMAVDKAPGVNPQSLHTVYAKPTDMFHPAITRCQ